MVKMRADFTRAYAVAARTENKFAKSAYPGMKIYFFNDIETNAAVNYPRPTHAPI